MPKPLAERLANALLERENFFDVQAATKAVVQVVADVNASYPATSRSVQRAEYVGRLNRALAPLGVKVDDALPQMGKFDKETGLVLLGARALLQSNHMGGVLMLDTRLSGPSMWTTVLAHELTHQHQWKAASRDGGEEHFVASYLKPDGSVDQAAYFKDKQELGAMASQAAWQIFNGGGRLEDVHQQVQMMNLTPESKRRFLKSFHEYYQQYGRQRPELERARKSRQPVRRG